MKIYNKKTGKIISVIGGPRSGKSFLVKKLADYYNATPILEGEEQDFPERIIEDIEKNIRPLERICWFRNKLVKEYLSALDLKNSGKTVILDTFWISCELYTDILTKGFENEIIRDLVNIDKTILPWPDVVIFLSLSESSVRNFIKLGGRNFDKNEDFIKQQAIPINNIHKDFFSKLDSKFKVITIERDNLDFDNEHDFKSVIDLIDKSLNKIN